MPSSEFSAHFVWMGNEIISAYSCYDGCMKNKTSGASQQKVYY
jgi:hypothetical protein